LVGFATTKVYAGIGADIVMESITLKTPSMSAMAWFRRLMLAGDLSEQEPKQ
jgi:hypothetical protein